ncbi:hypothetical protein [Vreelandella piezotolerans]|uniref:hypothetical protein n=1 Tax=Vreelandella piezotolerans TaxID=2609667 RepID=UPI00129D13B9|nr:hypothetical protein [Halomonas piezotolerans]QJA25490.1 hypothetical protein GYM47_16040 [Halomonas piezotolerans]
MRLPAPRQLACAQHGRLHIHLHSDASPGLPTVGGVVNAPTGVLCPSAFLTGW